MSCTLVVLCPLPRLDTPVDTLYFVCKCFFPLLFLVQLMCGCLVVDVSMHEGKEGIELLLVKRRRKEGMVQMGWTKSELRVFQVRSWRLADGW